jgi:hypothetical protein
MGAAPPITLLKRLFEAAGYRVDVRPDALVAVRADDHRTVVLDRGRRPLPELEAYYPVDAVHRTVVYDADPGPLVREDAAARGLEVLDTTTLGPGLGELLLPASPEATRSTDSEDDPLNAPFPVLPTEARTVRPRIDRAEAAERAGVPDARYTLRLVPFWVGGYRARTVGPAGSPGPVTHRMVAVNALTRTTEFWEEGDRELVDGAELAAPVFPPQLASTAAARLALEAIRRRHAGRVDHTEQHAGALVIESRRVLPSVEDVRVGPLALLLVPYWYAEGAAGRVVLDAVSGQAAPMADARDSPGVPE